MKILKSILAVSALSITITVPVFAGDMSTPASPAPSPPATCVCNDEAPTTVLTEAVDFGSTEGSNVAPGTFESSFAVDLLLALLSLF